MPVHQKETFHLRRLPTVMLILGHLGNTSALMHYIQIPYSHDKRTKVAAAFWWKKVKHKLRCSFKISPDFEDSTRESRETLIHIRSVLN